MKSESTEILEITLFSLISESCHKKMLQCRMTDYYFDIGHTCDLFSLIVTMVSTPFPG